MLCLTLSLGDEYGLSHDINFDNVDKNGQMLALISAAAGF